MFKTCFEVLIKTKGHSNVLAMGLDEYHRKIEAARLRSQVDGQEDLVATSSFIALELFERISPPVFTALSKLLPADKMSDGKELWHALCTKYSPSDDSVLEEGLCEKIALKIINAATRWHGRGPLSVFVQGL